VNEVVWVLKRNGESPEFIKEKVGFIFSLPLEYLVPDHEVFKRAIDIVGRAKVSFGDAQIAAHVLEEGMDAIASYDSDFDRIKGIRRVEAI